MSWKFEKGKWTGIINKTKWFGIEAGIVYSIIGVTFRGQIYGLHSSLHVSTIYPWMHFSLNNLQLFRPASSTSAYGLDEVTSYVSAPKLLFSVFISMALARADSLKCLSGAGDALLSDEATVSTQRPRSRLVSLLWRMFAEMF